MTYDLSHLTQNPDQAVMGPIQDDEALLLYAICRVCQMTRVIEFGGLHGYSARNFLAGMGSDGAVWSVDCDPIQTVGDRHFHVHKEAGSVTADDFTEEVDSKGIWRQGTRFPIRADLVFFDVHDLEQQLRALKVLEDNCIVHDGTLLVLHDTGLHPNKETSWSVPAPSGGWIHQQVEREMADVLRCDGWEAVEFSQPSPKPPLRYRHGLTLLRRTADQPLFEPAAPEHWYGVCRPGVKIG